ncbi:MAG: TIGR01777 family oxidoreductase [Niabella sp.]
MDTVLITGGTGLVGKRLVRKLLAKDYKVVILTRGNKPANSPGIIYAYWNVEKGIIDQDRVAEADYIINLAGANIAQKRWTKTRKQEIISSRVKSSTLLLDVLKKEKHHVKKIINASAIGWYGSDPVVPNPHPFVETDPHANDFLGATCYQWEQSILPAAELGITLVILRTGIVLSKEGGALKEFLKPLKLGFASVPGPGSQMISWIHLDDLVQLYITAMEEDAYKGIYNAVAPEPASGRHFVIELAKQTQGKYYSVLPVPASLLKLVLGEMSAEVLKSTTVSCAKVRQQGFEFLYPAIRAAIKQIVHPPAW